MFSQDGNTHSEANNVTRCLWIFVFHGLCVVVELVVSKEAIQSELHFTSSFLVKTPRLFGRDRKRLEQECGNDVGIATRIGTDVSTETFASALEVPEANSFR